MSSENVEDRFATQQEKEEFAELCNELQHTRDYWQVELAEAMRREEEEEKATNKLLRSALVNESHYCKDPSFNMWRNREESKSVSSAESLSKWYENDDLLALTPYAAVVPYPRNISGDGIGTVIAVADDVMNTGQPAGEKPDRERAGGAFLVRCTSIHSLVEESPGDEGEQTPSSPQGLPSRFIRPFHIGPFPDGLHLAATLATLDARPKSVLEETPCLLLDSVEHFQILQASEVGIVLAFVMCGKLTAVEFHPSGGKAAVAGSRVSSGFEDGGASLMSHLVTSVNNVIVPALKCRNLIAMFSVHANSSGDKSSGSGCHLFLLNAGPLEPRDYEFFSFDELSSLAQQRQQAEREKAADDANVASSAAPLLRWDTQKTMQNAMAAASAAVNVDAGAKAGTLPTVQHVDPNRPVAASDEKTRRGINPTVLAIASAILASAATVGVMSAMRKKNL